MEILDGDGGLALAAVVLFGLSFGLEYMALRRRWPGFFLVAFPLGEALVPLPDLPKGKGRSASLRWEVDEEEPLVRWWAGDAGSAIPRGLHGVAWLVPDTRRRVHLDIRWAPLWTPFVACLWLVLLGVARGEGGMTSAIAAMLSSALLYAYWTAATQAAAELRWSLLQKLEEQD